MPVNPFGINKRKSKNEKSTDGKKANISNKK
jgi:hypothetical protein